MSYHTRRIMYITVFVMLLLAPLLIMLLAPEPASRQWWREGAVALGFLGLSLMGWQFVSPVRLPFLTELIDLDTLYRVHHRLSRLAFYLVLAHPLILVFGNPYNFVAFNFISGVWKLLAGTVAFVLMAILVLTSVWREWLHLGYDFWHGLHDFLAALVLGFALYHILSVRYYTALPIQRFIWVVYAVMWSGLILYIRVVKPLQVLQRPWKLVDVREEFGNTWILSFEPVGHSGMKFRAGQAAWVTIDTSPFRLAAHPFSIASSALHPERMDFAIRELGDWTARVRAFLPGTRAYIDGPYGTFDLAHHPSSEYVFIAGGIGSAPILSILRTLADGGDQRRLHFFYGNR
ncbi:MAG: ferric reductase-like transmembrane domain-containing protein, partial [Anaerolineae bacterium]|nr:ferric reductase-like transmembrane domain-containing protein [Anaerolineae bacterium]